MSERYKANKENTLYFITFMVIKWIDLFTKPKNQPILIDSFKYCQKNKGLKIHAYVIMMNHLHAIVSS
jgi:putative transposase